MQLEHDLAELKITHGNLLTGLHQQIDALKQKNRGERQAGRRAKTAEGRRE